MHVLDGYVFVMYECCIYSKSGRINLFRMFCGYAKLDDKWFDLQIIFILNILNPFFCVCLLDEMTTVTFVRYIYKSRKFEYLTKICIKYAP